MNIIGKGLTFDDVLLVPAYAGFLPNQVSTRSWLCDDLPLEIPMLSAAMDTVTEAPMAIEMAQQGALGIIHKNMSKEVQAQQVMRVKKFESGVVQDPVTVSPTTTIAEVRALTAQYNVSGMPVVDGPLLVGIITHRDIRFEIDTKRLVSDLMTPKADLITAPVGASREQVMALFRQHRLEKVLLVNDAFELCGMVTVRDMIKSADHPLATKDSEGRLRVGAAVGTGAKGQQRAAALVAAGVDVLVLDTAHGFSQGVLDQTKWLKQHFSDTKLVVGNIATADAAIALADAGADAVKVGMGPGSICTTRIIAGIGVPQITAIADVATALKGRSVKVIADGGIRFSGDLSKALAAGADVVMLGSLLAGTTQAPGEVVLYQGRSYKTYRGMGSLGAMAQAHGSKDRYFQSEQQDPGKLVPEGIEGRVPFRGEIKDIVTQMMGGLRSSMGYVGCDTIEKLHADARFLQVTPAGMRESHVHDVTITKEAPNYSIED